MRGIFTTHARNATGLRKRSSAEDPVEDERTYNHL
jgi:hypothetical protein